MALNKILKPMKRWRVRISQISTKKSDSIVQFCSESQFIIFHLEHLICHFLKNFLMALEPCWAVVCDYPSHLILDLLKRYFVVRLIIRFILFIKRGGLEDFFFKIDGVCAFNQFFNILLSHPPVSIRKLNRFNYLSYILIQE